MHRTRDCDTHLQLDSNYLFERNRLTYASLPIFIYSYSYPCKHTQNPIVRETNVTQFFHTAIWKSNSRTTLFISDPLRQPVNTLWTCMMKNYICSPYIRVVVARRRPIYDDQHPRETVKQWNKEQYLLFGAPLCCHICSGTNKHTWSDAWGFAQCYLCTRSIAIFRGPPRFVWLPKNQGFDHNYYHLLMYIYK